MWKSALQSGDSFMWLLSLMKWSCIARYQNIDHISFFHVSVKGYAMVIEFNVTKMKKRGEKITPKNCYKCDDCCHWYYATHKNHKMLKFVEPRVGR